MERLSGSQPGGGSTPRSPCWYRRCWCRRCWSRPAPWSTRTCPRCRSSRLSSRRCRSSHRCRRWRPRCRLSARPGARLGGQGLLREECLNSLYAGSLLKPGLYVGNHAGASTLPVRTEAHGGFGPDVCKWYAVNVDARCRFSWRIVRCGRAPRLHVSSGRGKSGCCAASNRTSRSVAGPPLDGVRRVGA